MRGAALLAAAGLLIAGTAAAQLPGQALLKQAAAGLCPQALEAPATAGRPLGLTLTEVEDRGPPEAWVQRRIRFDAPEAGLVLTLEATRAGGALRRVVYQLHQAGPDRPLMTALADGGCAVGHGRAITYDADGQRDELLQLAGDLETVEVREPFNPPVPPGSDPGGVTVAHIDSGVNYLLPEIATRLARDAAGEILGRDFWELDRRPFDGDTGRSPFFPIRHGTPVAGLLIKEAPEIRLIPYRYPRPDMTRMAEAVEAAAAGGAAIVALPMGSSDPEDWRAFARAAEAYPELLFVVSAGNDGRDIDEAPLYPASLPLDNMIVVTSADDFGRLAVGSNWGVESVDLMVPAEQLEVLDFRGARGTASGSSYAVPRVAALAARLKAADPELSGPALKASVLTRAVPPLERGAPKVAVGWIPNPADDR